MRITTILLLLIIIYPSYMVSAGVDGSPDSITRIDGSMMTTVNDTYQKETLTQISAVSKNYLQISMNIRSNRSSDLFFNTEYKFQILFTRFSENNYVFDRTELIEIETPGILRTAIELDNELGDIYIIIKILPAFKKASKLFFDYQINLIESNSELVLDKEMSIGPLYDNFKFKSSRIMRFVNNTYLFLPPNNRISNISEYSVQIIIDFEIFENDNTDNYIKFGFGSVKKQIDIIEERKYSIEFNLVLKNYYSIDIYHMGGEIDMVINNIIVNLYKSSGIEIPKEKTQVILLSVFFLLPITIILKIGERDKQRKKDGYLFY